MVNFAPRAMLRRMLGTSPPSPTAPAEPAPVRREPHLGPARRQRSFAAAKHSHLTAAWANRSTGADANREIYADLTTLVWRSREQSINSPHAKRFYKLLKQNVIGPRGIAFQSRAVTRDEKPDELARRRIERAFKRFSKKGACDVTRSYSLRTFLNLWLETLARDGEVMVREIRGFANACGYALQIIECDRLDINLNTENHATGNRIVMGVEIDEYEAPVAYWLLHDHPGDTHRSAAKERHFRVPVGELIHTFMPWRPHQRRGIPWGHASMLELHHLEEYRRSEMIASEINAKKLGVYEQDAETAEALGLGGEDDQGEIHEELEAGTYQLLPVGVTLKPVPTSHPATNFAPFVEQALRGVAAGFGGPGYNKLAHDLKGVSFSSLRSSELDERDGYKDIQRFVIEEFLDRVGASWLAQALLFGAVEGSIRDLDRLGEINWLARGWDWVDPTKDAKAASESINNRTKSRSSVIRQNGDDPDEVFDEIAREEERLRERGINIGQGATSDNATPPPNASADDDEDDNEDD